jgi:hypothetical protein
MLRGFPRDHGQGDVRRPRPVMGDLLVGRSGTGAVFGGLAGVETACPARKRCRMWRLRPEDPESARAQVLIVFAMMAGTVQLSRALADRQLAGEVLEAGIKSALALFGAAHHG